MRRKASTNCAAFSFVTDQRYQLPFISQPGRIIISRLLLAYSSSASHRTLSHSPLAMAGKSCCQLDSLLTIGTPTLATISLPQPGKLLACTIPLAEYCAELAQSRVCSSRKVQNSTGDSPICVVNSLMIEEQPLPPHGSPHCTPRWTCPDDGGATGASSGPVAL